jgi:hypothetical protein
MSSWALRRLGVVAPIAGRLDRNLDEAKHLAVSDRAFEL